jgi:hypothetical protein
VTVTRAVGAIDAFIVFKWFGLNHFPDNISHLETGRTLLLAVLALRASAVIFWLSFHDSRELGRDVDCR